MTRAELLDVLTAERFAPPPPRPLEPATRAEAEAAAHRAQLEAALRGAP